MVKSTAAIFFVSFMVHLSFSAYVLFTGYRDRYARLASLLFFLNAVWAFGFSMRPISLTYMDALYWSKFAAIGWASLYAIHFLWIYNYLYKKYRWVFSLLSIVLVAIAVWTYVFSAHANDFFPLEITSQGYVDIGSYSADEYMVTNFYFSIYYGFAFFSALIMLGVNVFKTKDAEKKKNSKLIFVGTFLTFFFAIILDKVLPFFLNEAFPSYAVVFAIISETSILIVLNREKRLSSERLHLPKYYEGVDLLAIKIWTRIEVIIALTSCFVVLVFGILFDQINRYLFVFLITSMLISLLIHLICHLVRNIHWVNMISTCILSIYFAYTGIVGNDLSMYMAWFYPICFMPLFVLFDKKRYLLIFGLSSIAVVFYTMMVFGIRYTEFMFYNQVKKIFLYIIFWSSIIYVNSYYIKRVKHNSNHIAVQESFADISALFIDVSRENFKTKVLSTLNTAMLHMNADRVFLIFLDDEGGEYHFGDYYETKRDGVLSIRNSLRVNDASKLTWLINELHHHEMIRIENVLSLPEEAVVEKLFFSSFGTKGSIITGIFLNKKLSGFMVASIVESNQQFDASDEDFILFVSSVVSEAVFQIESDKIIHRLAYHNALTNLPNGLEFNRILDAQIEKFPDAVCGVAHFNIDFFQEVNDVISHEGGDELLRRIADDVLARLGKNDVLVHYSGDDFAVLIREVYSVDDIIAKVSEIKSILGISRVIQEREFFISTSMGVSIYTKDARSREELIQHAELALFTAKMKGRNQYVMCTGDLIKENRYYLDVQNSMYKSIEREEFYIEFQPEVCLETGTVSGVEALLRWNNPNFGLIPALEILAISDEVGYNQMVCKYVVSEVTRQLSKWHSTGIDVTVTINFSVSDILSVDVCGLLREYIQKYSLSSQSIIVEFPESAVNSITTDFIDDLKELGVKISIDKFGSQNSSLSRIVSLDIDRIKIDRNFVQQFNLSEKDSGIAKSIIEIGKNLEFNVGVVGIETEEQYEFFRDNGCDVVQGFAFYEPMRSVDIMDLLLFERRRMAEKYN